jgi:hypothetical protein
MIVFPLVTSGMAWCIYKLYYFIQDLLVNKFTSSVEISTTEKEIYNAVNKFLSQNQFSKKMNQVYSILKFKEKEEIFEKKCGTNVEKILFTPAE